MGQTSVDTPEWVHNRRWMEAWGIQGFLSLRWALPSYSGASFFCRNSHMNCVPA